MRYWREHPEECEEIVRRGGDLHAELAVKFEYFADTQDPVFDGPQPRGPLLGLNTENAGE